MVYHRFEQLNEDNYESYALHAYDNPQCEGIEEFREDLEDRPKWIKRLLRRYHNGGELRERLIINHLIIFINVFGIEAGTKILFFKLEPSLHTYLKTFLMYLHFYRRNIPGMYLDLEDIEVDEKILKELEKI